MAVLNYSSPSPPSLISSFRNSTSISPLFTVPATRRRSFPSFRIKSSLAVESPAASGTSNGGESPKILLQVKDLTAVIAQTEQPILKGVNLCIYEGEVKSLYLYMHIVCV